MKKIIWSHKSKESIKGYITEYRWYFLELYSDTGLGESEAIIKENYNKEAKTRRKEILILIENRLSNEVILGRTLVNSLILQWRSKLVFITWEDIGEDIRRIVDLEIR